jgi:hypothetical protein
MENQKAGASLVTRKIFAPIVRLILRCKIAVSRKKVDDPDDGKTGKPMYPPELIEAMQRLDDTLYRIGNLVDEARVQLHEGIGKVEVKTRLRDFIFEMKPYMSSRLELKLMDYNRHRCDGNGYLEDLDEKTFFGIRGAGKVTYEDFLQVREKFYKTINKR